MTFQVVPTDLALPFWTQTTTLDGAPYLLSFNYNSREQCYYLSIDSVDGLNNYVQGVKLVSNYFLLRPYGAVPPGEMMVLSSSTVDDTPAKLGELGDGVRCSLLYIPAADLFAGPKFGEPERFPGYLV